jgi:carbon-monoxide dehydrogenase medium subunit
VKPPRFRYHGPRALDQALALLADLPNARLLAGGQSLMPLLNFRIAYPDDLIDLNRLPELTGIEERGPSIVIGAMTRQRALELSPVVRARLPLLVEALRHVGHRATRNRGTIGGSLCHLDPAAELPLVAGVHDAILHIRSRRGTRTLPMSDFATAVMTPALESDELLAALELAPWGPGHGWGFAEFARGHGAFALAAVAVLVTFDAGRIARSSIRLGGVAAGPLRVAAAEQILLGSAGDAAAITAAAAACGDIEPIEQPSAPAWYRRRLCSALARRALAEACARATRGVAP